MTDSTIDFATGAPAAGSLAVSNDRALLLDTGATADPAKFPLRATVDGLVDDWLTRHPREGYQLVVVHTHGHGDHVAGDAQFAGRLATTVVSRELDAVRQHFGFTGSPGHHRAAITVYDP
ncbi:MAG: MBL fold metallo-hydrolase [Streptosporangiaceae bacterium]|jgi:glyoxylase-like metal-dependent hydrolase (beta-lactamase superfamily II)